MHRGQQAVFSPLKQLKADPQGSGGGSFCCFSLEGTKHWHSGAKRKELGVFSSTVFALLIPSLPSRGFDRYIFLNLRLGSGIACRTQAGSNNVTIQSLLLSCQNPAFQM